MENYLYYEKGNKIPYSVFRAQVCQWEEFHYRTTKNNRLESCVAAKSHEPLQEPYQNNSSIQSGHQPTKKEAKVGFRNMHSKVKDLKYGIQKMAKLKGKMPE